MKPIYIHILLLMSCCLFAQTKEKKEILLDENNQSISALEFKKNIAPPDYKFTYTKFENDTAVFGKLLLRKVYGTLKEEDHIKIIAELEKLSGNDIKDHQTIIINFFYIEPTRNQRPCIDQYTSDRAFGRFVRRNKDIAQFFVTTKNYSYDKENVYEDKEGIIANLLFPYEIHCGNYIIIKPNGHYYRQLSEYRQDEIPKILEADW